jgi:hypothetical protein
VKGLVRIILATIAMAFVLAVFTDYTPPSRGAGTRRLSGDSRTEVWGLPVVSVRQSGAHGWLSMGQGATGVLVIAQAGAGVVAFTQVGVGALFGIGQGMFSLVAIGQLGVGFFAFVGQIGLGTQAMGQAVARRRPREYFDEISEEISRLLSWSGR